MISGFYVTTKGQDYIAGSMANRALVITKAQFGSGVPPEGTDPLAITGLVNPLGQLGISEVKSEAGTTTIATQFSNRVGGQILPAFHLTEVGIFGKLQTYDGANDPEKPEALLSLIHI